MGEYLSSCDGPHGIIDFAVFNERAKTGHQSLQYSVVFHTAEEGGFWVEVPALPGCYSQGESVEESLRNVTEAIELYLEVLRDEGRDVPQDAEVVYQVSVADTRSEHQHNLAYPPNIV